jgi:raffinose/stachyose/melibiose transport system permease protein
VRPGLAAVAVFTMLPVWNDLWFPILLAPGESTLTVTLGAQKFLGQYASDWNAVLAALTLAMLPVLVLYIIFSRQFLGGLTRGAID